MLRETVVAKLREVTSDGEAGDSVHIECSRNEIEVPSRDVERRLVGGVFDRQFGQKSWARVLADDAAIFFSQPDTRASAAAEPMSEREHERRPWPKKR
jgi:hypothetical protein